MFINKQLKRFAPVRHLDTEGLLDLCLVKDRILRALRGSRELISHAWFNTACMT